MAELAALDWSLIGLKTLLAGLVSLIAWRLRTLTGPGSVVMGFMGLTILLFAGWLWLIPAFTFLLTSALLGWTGGQFETVNEPPGTQNVTESWESLLIDASDVIASTAQATSVSGQPSSQGVTTEERAEVNMHAVLEELAVEQGVLGAFVVGDSGVLVDHVITAYAGSPDDIAELGKGLKAISRIRDAVEEDSENRVILQFEKTRILAMEISDTAVYLIILTTGAGVLARLLEQLNSAVKRLATLF